MLTRGGLAEWLLHAPRTGGFLARNREGVLTLPGAPAPTACLPPAPPRPLSSRLGAGYALLFAAGAAVGQRSLWQSPDVAADRGSALAALGRHRLAYAAVSWLFWASAHFLLGADPSRRMVGRDAHARLRHPGPSPPPRLTSRAARRWGPGELELRPPDVRLRGDPAGHGGHAPSSSQSQRAGGQRHPRPACARHAGTAAAAFISNSACGGTPNLGASFTDPPPSRSPRDAKANLLTGAVNLGMDTVSADPTTAFFVLLAYVGISIAATVALPGSSSQRGG